MRSTWNREDWNILFEIQHNGQSNHKIYGTLLLRRCNFSEVDFWHLKTDYRYQSLNVYEIDTRDTRDIGYLTPPFSV